MAPTRTAPRNPIQLRAAFRAIRKLLANPDDTAQVFEIIRALSGNTGERAYKRFRASETGRRILEERRELIDTLRDGDALRALPPGSLGRTYAEFIEREQISADGLVAASEQRGPVVDDPQRALFGARLRDMHDLWHVVTGYQRDLVGEASLLAFTFAQLWNPGIGFIVLVAYLRARGDFQPARKMIRHGFGRGRRAAWLPGQDWEALLAMPLEEVRSQLRVGSPPDYDQVRSEAAPALA